MGENTNSERQMLSLAAEKWQPDFDQAFNQVLENEAATLDEMVEVIWQKGILDRIAPLDPQVKAARQSLGREVWPGERSQPAFYWQIVYSAADQRNTMKKCLTTHPSYLSSAISAWARMTAFPEKLVKLAPQTNGDTIQLFNLIIDKIEARARQESIQLGEEIPEDLISIGQEINFHDLNLTVANYTGDGMICLRPHNLDDHIRLGELTGYTNTINPRDLYSYLNGKK